MLSRVADGHMSESIQELSAIAWSFLHSVQEKVGGELGVKEHGKGSSLF